MQKMCEKNIECYLITLTWSLMHNLSIYGGMTVSASFLSKDRKHAKNKSYVKIE